MARATASEDVRKEGVMHGEDYEEGARRARRLDSGGGFEDLFNHRDLGARPAPLRATFSADGLVAMSARERGRGIRAKADGGGWVVEHLQSGGVMSRMSAPDEATARAVVAAWAQRN
jgi:hypothetical protein